MKISSRLWVANVTALLLVACGAAQQTLREALIDDPFRLASDVAPIEQQLNLRIDPKETKYSGSTTITIEISGS